MLRGCAAIAISGLLVACTTIPFEEQHWISVETENFSILSSAEEEKTLELAESLELFRLVLHQLSRVELENQRIPVRVYIFNGSFGPFRLEHLMEGYLLPRLHANYVAINARARTETLETVRHEYVHHVLRNQGTLHYPPWYDEGFSEFMSTTQSVGESVSVGRIPTGPSWRLYRGKWLPLRKVITAQSLSEIGPYQSDEVAMFYAQAWLLTHYLHTGPALGFPNRAGQRDRYLQLINRNFSAEDAFDEAFDVSFVELGQELRRFYAKGKVVYSQYPKSVFPIDFNPRVRTAARWEALAYLGDLLLQLGGETRARHAERAFRLALEDRPDYGFACIGLGWALALQGVATADGYIQRGLALGAEDPIVQLYAGNYFLARAQVEADREQRLELASRARTHFARVRELSPDLPAGNASFGEVALVDGRQVGAAVEALETARRALRWNVRIAMILGELYRQEGRHEEARELLAEVVTRSHSKTAREHAQSLLDSMPRALSGPTPSTE